jgi:hypothetical protein
LTTSCLRHDEQFGFRVTQTVADKPPGEASRRAD